ncbi:PAS domain-containing sensor histidine kinase [Flavobacteriales bacterium]|nr:PAS domain-containing sensor histidine kinase [Flavobacteriales bacterium]
MRQISTYEMLDVIFDNIDHVVFVTNVDGLDLKILHINDTFETFGVDKEFLSSDPYLFFKMVIHPDDKRMLIRSFITSLKNKKPVDFDFRIIKPNEHVYWLYGKFIPVISADGFVTHMVGISADVTQRKEEELRLNNLYKVQGDVVKMLAHDLRTPISGVKIIAESFLRTNKKELAVNDIRQIVSNCKETLLLMEDLLSYIQTDVDYIQLHISEFIVEERIHFVAESFLAEITEKEITVHLPHTQTLFSLDSLRFSQILTNLMSNAIKFSNSSGVISVYLETTDRGLTINISDKGIGIPEDDLPFIFDVFTSTKRLGTQGEKSTGLGLSISKRLIELHKGTIDVVSKENEGTIIQLFFPNP